MALGARVQTPDRIRFLSLSFPLTHHSTTTLRKKKVSQNIATEFLCVKQVKGYGVDESNVI